MARPSYKPTASDRETVTVMAAGGFDQDIIARCLGEKGIAPKTLRLHFRKELDTANAMANAVAVAKLQKAIENGEAWAICFRLKCRAGWREKHDFEHTGPGGGPIAVSTTAAELLESKLAQLEERSGQAETDPRPD